MATLECHSRGDKRFSPFFAQVTIFGKTATIEHFYQTGKRFGMDAPKDWREAKKWQKEGRQYTHFVLPNGMTVELTGHTLRLPLHVQFYVLMWVKYLDEHHELVEYARGFDEFNDPFAGDFPMCQARCVEMYVKQGRKALVDEGMEVSRLIRMYQNKEGVWSR